VAFFPSGPRIRTQTRLADNSRETMRQPIRPNQFSRSSLFVPFDTWSWHKFVQKFYSSFAE
jgi:hypothetical protein